MDTSEYFEANKQLWNKKTPVHVQSGFYNVAAFKDGATSLNSIELEEVGDVKGKTLLHLQCHFGMDTISWARNGAIATGLDFSDQAIEQAHALAAEVNQSVSFVCSNVYDAPQNIHEQFDIVFTSYGTIGWLPNLDKWAAVISQILKPGGKFHIVDFHPLVWMFDNDFQYFKYSYFNTGQPIEEENTGTYADRTADLKDKEYGWNHPISDILNALIGAGLTISFFNEHNYSPYNCLNNMVEISPGKWQLKGMEDKMPLLYSIGAVKNV